MFVDSAKISIKAGNGGNGCVSFHREKFIATGGPDGGDGGRGGNIVFVVDEGLHTLADFRYKRKYVAPNGKDGTPGNCTGKGAEHTIIKVPSGTVIIDDNTGKVVADLTTHGQEIIICKGGKGGAGNQHFATATRQLPSFAKPGRVGEEMRIVLELKLLADAGLVGYPNAGKSTILSMVSAARPKIADYPFTTLKPNLGVVRIRDGEAFVIADIPGLIEGAHEGIGLGHEFLKHIERTRILVHVVDLAGVDGREPLKDFQVINNELKEYSAKLADRPQIVVANKMDVPEAQERFVEFKEEVEKLGYEVFSISAATNQGVTELMNRISIKLKEIPIEPLFEIEEKKTIYTVKEEIPFLVRREEDYFVIEGDWVNRLINSTNFGDMESLQYFQRVLKKRGVSDELEKMGIEEGDTVIADGVEFEYYK